MALFRRNARPPQEKPPMLDKRVSYPPEDRLTTREKAWALIGALIPFAPSDPEIQSRIEEHLRQGCTFGKKVILPPAVAASLLVTSSVPLKASDGPAFGQRMAKWFMNEVPRDAATWVATHSAEISAAAHAYKQYAVAMRLYERVARSRDIGFTLAFEIPPVRLANDLGGNGYDDVVIRPAGASDLMLQKMSPKHFGVNFDFSALKSQMNGLLMGKWDVDYSRVTVGPDGSKTVQRDPGIILAECKALAVASWVFGDRKINPFGEFVDAGEDTRTNYDLVSKDLHSSWQRRIALRDRVQRRLLDNIRALEARGADATALRDELNILMVSRGLDEAITADSNSATGQALGEARLKALKNLDSQGLASMELLAANRFRNEMAAQNQAATTDAVGQASLDYNAKNDLSGMVGDISDLSIGAGQLLGLAFAHQTAAGSAQATSSGWQEITKAVNDARKAASPENANREAIGSQVKQCAYLSGQEQHLAEILRTLTETSIDQQNTKIQGLVQARTQQLSEVASERIDSAVEERSQDAVDEYSQGLDQQPRVGGIHVNMAERKLIPEDGSSNTADTLEAMLNAADQEPLNVVASSDASSPKETEQATKDARAQVSEAYTAKFKKELGAFSSILKTTLENTNWKGYLGFLDPVIEGLNKGISAILGKPFDLGNADRYERLQDRESI